MRTSSQQRRMRQALALGVVGSGMGLLGWRHQGARVDQSSPGAAVRSFVTAFSARDGAAMTACVKGAQASAGLNALLTATDAPGGWVKTATVNSVIVEGDANHASVAVELTLRPSQGSGNSTLTLTSAEIFHLERSGDRWLIVPDAAIEGQIAQPKAPTLENSRYFLRPLASTVALAGLPNSGLQAAQQAHLVATATNCLSNMKQLGTAMTMYVQDFDETFPRKNASYSDQVYPYVKTRSMFTCPLDAKGTISYTMNANMQGVGLALVLHPTQTVLLYEGKNMQMQFRHDGKAAVCFVDGHAKMMTPDEVKSVFWYPNGKTAAFDGGSKPKGAGKPKK